MSVGYRVSRLVLVTLLILIRSTAIASDSTSTTDDLSIPAPESLDGTLGGNNSPKFLLSAADGALKFTLDEDSKEKLGKAIIENYLWTMDRNADIFAWQDYSTKIIFFVVLFLVSVGVVFSGIQFYKGYRTKRTNDEVEQLSQVEFSAKGIKVSSPFLGVIILVISLAFFYLYLVYVYPISLTN